MRNLDRGVLALAVALGAASCSKAFTNVSGTDDGKTPDASVPQNTGGSAGAGGSAAGESSGGRTSPGGSGSGGIATSTGGKPGSGGGANAGGTSGTGGAPNTGGAKASGGTPNVGGTGGKPTATVPEAGIDTAVPSDGLLLWLRADKGVTEHNGAVSAWADQSPSHSDAMQSTASLEPAFVGNGINGQPTLLFDGVDDFLFVPVGFSDFSNGLTMFAVAETNTADICSGVIEASNGSEIDDISLDEDHGQLNYEVFDSNNEDVIFPASTPQAYAVVHRTDESVEIWRNGFFGTQTSFALPTVTARMAIYVGQTLYANCSTFSGKISEIIVYGRALSDADVLAVNGYLQTKYACCDQQ